MMDPLSLEQRLSELEGRILGLRSSRRILMTLLAQQGKAYHAQLGHLQAENERLKRRLAATLRYRSENSGASSSV